MSNIDAMIKQSSEEDIVVEKKHEKGNPDILDYLEKEYPAKKYNADFCKYIYKWGNLYGINFWEKVYKDGCNNPSNRIFRRMILKVIETPDGPSVEVDTDEGEFKGFPAN